MYENITHYYFRLIGGMVVMVVGVGGMLSQSMVLSFIYISEHMISWHMNRPDFDILLMSNCKYHIDINTWGQYNIKNVFRKWSLAIILSENEFWKKKHFGWFYFVSVSNINLMPTPQCFTCAVTVQCPVECQLHQSYHNTTMIVAHHKCVQKG